MGPVPPLGRSLGGRWLAFSHSVRRRRAPAPMPRAPPPPPGRGTAHGTQRHRPAPPAYGSRRHGQMGGPGQGVGTGQRAQLDSPQPGCHALKMCACQQVRARSQSSPVGAAIGMKAGGAAASNPGLANASLWLPASPTEISLTCSPSTMTLSTPSGSDTRRPLAGICGRGAAPSSGPAGVYSL